MSQYWPKPELPSFVWKMTQLQELYCYSSSISSMPPAIRKMTNLKELSPYTSYNLRYLPYEVPGLLRAASRLASALTDRT